MKPEAVIHGDGNAPNLLTDLRDIGRFVARIVGDERTLNRYVYTWSDVLSENEIFEIVEEGSGEKIERQYVCSALHCISTVSMFENAYNFVQRKPHSRLRNG